MRVRMTLFCLLVNGSLGGPQGKVLSCEVDIFVTSS